MSWIRTVGSIRALGLVSALGWLALGCTSTHTGTDDDAGTRTDASPPPEDSGVGRVLCGPTQCAAGQVCCNESCGICTEPGGACIDLECGAICGDEACTAGETCCTGCPGDADFCVAGTQCPEFDCPPDPPGCESCAVGDLCCPGCPGQDSFCAEGAGCPDLICPPDLTCQTSADCGPDDFCDTGDSCGGVGVCSSRPLGCTRDCPGVCGCDGATYCNECNAQRDGRVTLARRGACEPQACEGRDYCDCNAECEPLIDLGPGCICECDDPFNCTGDTCLCACGGAEYRGCAQREQCATTQLDCGPGCSAVLGGAGCLECVCDTPVPG